MAWNEMVQKLMKDQDINQKKLSSLTGIAESSLSRYLRSDKTPRLDVVVNVAKALHVNTEYFLGIKTDESAFDSIATAIARKGNELSPEEKNKLISLIIGKL